MFSGSLDGHFRAYNSSNGKVLLDVNTLNEYNTVNNVPARGGSINGPGATIAAGMVFVNSGYARSASCRATCSCLFLWTGSSCQLRTPNSQAPKGSLLLGVGSWRLGVDLEVPGGRDVGGADAAVVQRRGDEGRVASRLRDLHEIIPSADAAAGNEARSWRG